MSIIMDRLFDLGAIDWQGLPITTLEQWEQEALNHSKQCRCAKCALFFARLSPREFRLTTGCAIREDVIEALRDILSDCNKIK